MTVDLEAGELAGSLGLGNSHSRTGSMQRTLERLERFRMAKFSGPDDLDVYTETPPLTGRTLDRLPSWTRDRHEHLLGMHLDEVARLQSRSDLSARLDRLTQPRTPAPPDHAITR